MKIKDCKISAIRNVLFVAIIFSGLFLFFPTMSSQAAVSGDYEYTVSGNEATITRYNGTSDHVELPSTISGYHVTRLGDGYLGVSMFANQQTVKTVKVPDSVVEINNSAFYECKKLENVVFSKNLKVIKGIAFQSCISLSEIEIPDGVVSLGGSVFYGCSKLEKVIIPNSVNDIGMSAFGGCNILEEINLPSQLTSLSAGLFVGDRNLKSITIPQTVLTIMNDAFLGCSGLENVTFFVQKANGRKTEFSTEAEGVKK